MQHHRIITLEVIIAIMKYEPAAAACLQLKKLEAIFDGDHVTH